MDQLYPHIRVVMSIILGLGITTLLTGIASIIEHPKRRRWSWVHMLWVAWALVSIVTFWWWEFALVAVPRWSFGGYLFIISYCSLYFMLSSLLFPKDLRDYGSYEAYLLDRRYWFFGLVGLIALVDLGDTALKGGARWHALGAAYPVHTLATLAIAVLGMTLRRSRPHLALAACALVYQIGYFAVEYVALSAG